ncbi:endonuclease/exonuclease/phosphatase family protein [uncultured Aquimarina sp.]|uniref:endonuclease/exonuclease/phosphatase family protein n=1 Tax=uncultured Aquimarina sp. TaxID=575652 RepID=UPI00261C7172|nr:endonuclease/exonuclease/phosphatase family protein [uncultured Aquimarina sp.]
MKRHFIYLSKRFLLIFFSIEVFIHFTVKDIVYPINILFYLSAPLLLIIGSLVMSILFFKNKKVFYVLIMCFFSLVFYWRVYYYKTTSIEKSTDSYDTVLFWNIGRNGEDPFKIIMKEIENISPEFAGLVEADCITNEHLEEFRNRFPNYQIRKLEGGMLVIVKGRIDVITYHYALGFYKFNVVDFNIENQKRSILIADINAVPFDNRTSSLDIVYRSAKDHNCSFIMGDFNTPYESIYFNQFRQNLYSFHDVANGFTTTWPYGIPLFEIDQIWSSKNNTPILLKKAYYNTSDHALLIGFYQFITR